MHEYKVLSTSTCREKRSVGPEGGVRPLPFILPTLFMCVLAIVVPVL